MDSATVRSVSKYTAETVDWRGKLAFIEASKLAGVKMFFYFSMLYASKNASIPLINLKIKLEKELVNSGINYTIFECSGFLQGLISQYALPVLDSGTIWLSNDIAPQAYLDTEDAAKAIMQTIKSPAYETQKVSIIGRRFWTSKEIVQLCERLSGKTAKIASLPSFAFGIFRYFFRLADVLRSSGTANFEELADIAAAKNGVLAIAALEKKSPQSTSPFCVVSTFHRRSMPASCFALTLFATR